MTLVHLDLTAKYSPFTANFVGASPCSGKDQHHSKFHFNRLPTMFGMKVNPIKISKASRHRSEVTQLNTIRLSLTRQCDDGINNYSPRSKSIWENLSSKHSMSSPPIDHEHTPRSRPQHRPQPTNPSLNLQPRYPRKCDLHDRTNAH